MKIEVFDTEATVAQKAALFIAEEARQAINLRGRFMLAVSGGKTPWLMLRALAKEPISWQAVHIFQVDERIAPEGHADRNLTHLRESLSEVAPLLASCIHAMPVEELDTESGAAIYANTIREIAGSSAVIDLIHLGLGSDGHTASLIPNDPVLNVVNNDVAVTGIYMNRRRMTLTYPIINRARKILWLATGSEKREMLQRLLNNDQSIPAGRVDCNQALVMADIAATENLKFDRLRL